MKNQITIPEFAQKLIKLKEDQEITFTFKDGSLRFRAAKIKCFNAKIILIVAYGGNETYSCSMGYYKLWNMTYNTICVGIN